MWDLSFEIKDIMWIALWLQDLNLHKIEINLTR